jgi:hypothetical protein
MGTLSDAGKRHLQALIFDHKVLFEVRPAYSVYSGERIQVGFDVQLSGTHSQGVLEGHEPQPTPGCERCVLVWEHLDEIAQAVLPPEGRPSGYEISSFRPAISYYSKRRPKPTIDRPDVELVIEIRHREDFNREVDACETKCLQEILSGLCALGVQEGTWNETRARLFLRDRPAEGSPSAGPS